MKPRHELELEDRTMVEEILADIFKRMKNETDFKGAPLDLSLSETYWEMVLAGSIPETSASICKRHAAIKG